MDPENWVLVDIFYGEYFGGLGYGPVLNVYKSHDFWKEYPVVDAKDDSCPE